jgi:proteasome lid subunit RPN8/RPN11
MPAARIGDLTTHGGVIVMGCPTVIIGEAGGGAGGGGAAPAAAVPPTAAEILADPNVRQAMRQAWEDSDDGGPNDHEEGGYIVQNPDGSLAVVRVPSGDEDSVSFDIHESGMIGDQRIVGTFHTHPNTGTTYDDTPSDADTSNSRDYPTTMGPHQFILSPNDVYHVDNAGQVSTVGSLNETIGN